MTEAGLDLADLVHVRERFLRSIHLEHDSENEKLIDDYVITAQSLLVIRYIAEGLEATSTERAFTITGPYGTGKSALAVFLSHLLGKLGRNNLALDQLSRIEPVLAEDLQANVSDNGNPRPLLPVLISARRVPIHTCLLEGLLATSHRMSYDPTLLREIETKLDDANNARRIDARKFMKIINKVNDFAISQGGYSGLCLIIDELGKVLEYAARHPQDDDVYVLQELAEEASRSRNRRLLVIGLLHQSFERYGEQLDSAKRNEWAKIQGRFMDIAFIEPPAQMIRLVSSALKRSGHGFSESLSTRLRKVALDGIDRGLALPMLKPEELIQLAVKSYPLHPLTLVILPYLFRRFAQNERTLFSFLASNEPLGFQEFVRSTKFDAKFPKFIRLFHLFDYFALNLGSAIRYQPQARPWLEAINRLEQLNDLSDLEAKIVKVVGLLTVVGQISPLRPTKNLIEYALEGEECPSATILDCLDRLEEKSVLTFRRFNETYRLWEGSDIDIEEKLNEARHRIGNQIGISDAIKQYLSPRPLIASRHSYETGAVRFFELIYVEEPGDIDMSTLEISGDGVVLCCLASSSEDLDRFITRVNNQSFKNENSVIMAFPGEVGPLRQALVELRALHWVRKNLPELRDDQVAKRELAARIADVERSVNRLLGQLLDPAPKITGHPCQWFYKGQKQPIRTMAQVSQLLTKVSDELYCQAPRIRNELINRRELSSAAAAARNKLIERMLTKTCEPLLGIKGFPPERSMYESVLRASGLHRELGPHGWGFDRPPEEDPLNLLPAWTVMENLIFDTTAQANMVQIAEIFSILASPPYGVMPGILPILLCSFILANQDELSVYRNGTFLPEIRVSDFEVLMKNPSTFAVAGVRVTGKHQLIVDRLAHGFNVPAATVPVVRALIKAVRSLPDYAWRTERLTPEVLALRSAIERARSPEQLLFRDIPVALGFDIKHALDVHDFFNALNKALQAWSRSTDEAIYEARDFLLTSCGFPEGNAGWLEFRVASRQLEPYVTHMELMPFVERAVNSNDDEKSVLVDLLAYIAQKRPERWTDHDFVQFKSRAQRVGRLFQHFRGSIGKIPFADEHLSSSEKAQSLRLANDLRRYLCDYEDGQITPKVIRATLLNLVEYY